jgi:hypothetical protein
MATITELARAKMIMAMALAIGEEEANVLATAPNLDRQLASRHELQMGLLAGRNEIESIRFELRSSLSLARSNAEFESVKAEISRVIRRQTRQLFIGLISLMATMFAMLGGLLAISGKL